MESPDDLSVVSAKCPRSIIQILDILSENRSDAVRQLLQLGAQALGDPETMAERLALHALTRDLRSLAEALPGGSTPSGAAWAALPEQLPEVPPSIAVIASPTGVILHGLEGVLTVQADGLELVAPDRTESRELTTVQLLQLGSQLGTVLLTLAQRPAKAELPCGLFMERTPHGPVAIGVGQESVLVDPCTAWQFAAEVLSFAAAQLGQQVEIRADLEHRLEEVPSW